MTIVAALDGGSAHGDAATHAKQLQEAIRQHRSTLDALLGQRRRHAVELRNAGWQFGPIGKLYGLTAERARQLVSVPTRCQHASGGTAR